MSSTNVMVTEAQLGMTQSHWLSVHLLVAIPLPAGVLLRHVDASLQHVPHPGVVVSTIGTPEVGVAGIDGHTLDTVSMVAATTTVRVDYAQIYLPPSSQLLLTYCTITDMTGLSPWFTGPQVPVSTAHTFELTKILH